MYAGSERSISIKDDDNSTVADNQIPLIDKHQQQQKQKKDDVEDVHYIYDECFRPGFLPLLILVPPLIPVFMSYSVRMTDKYIRFGYSCGLRRTVNYSQIKSFRVEWDLSGFMRFGGYGFRRNLIGEIGYIVHDGPHIRIRYKGICRAPVLFTTTNPNEVRRLLLQMGVKEE